MKSLWGNAVGGISGTRRLCATSGETANSGVVEAVFNVGFDAEWTNQQISQLRLDTVDSAPNSTVWIDWIRAGTQADLPSGPTDIVYVDFGHAGVEDGTSSFPWNRLQEALNVVDSDGLVNIIKNSGDNDTTETFSGGGIISQNVTIDAVDGLVRIGTL